MIANLKPYPTKKESGVDWLGEVPAHWGIRRLKILCNMHSGDAITEEQIESVGDFPVYGGNGIRGYTSKYNHDGTFILIGRQGALCGNVHVARGRFWASEHAVVVTPRSDYFPRWLGAMLEVTNLNQYSIAAAQPGLSVERILELPIPVPPVCEQTAIARFLDPVDRHIRRYIHAKQKLIGLMEEQKQAIIQQAVTGQIDVQTGRPYPAYRASRLECFRHIPEHWRFARLKDVAQVQLGLTLGKDYRGTQTISRPYLRVANVQDGRVDLSHVKSVEVPVYEAEVTTLAEGDVLMTEGGDVDKLGRGCVWRDDIQGCLHQNHIFAVRCRQESLKPEFLVGLMASRYGRSYFQLTAKQTTNLASTNSSTLRAFPIPLPSVSDQEAILRFVSRNTRLLDEAIGRTETAIDRVREYLTRLINDVVTGTVDVREAFASSDTSRYWLKRVPEPNIGSSYGGRENLSISGTESQEDRRSLDLHRNKVPAYVPFANFERGAPSE